MEFFSTNMAPIMFIGLVIFLLMGYSVAFSLGACGLLFGFIGIEMGMLPPSLMQALPLRIFGIMQNDTLLAIPFFTFMGLILERSGMAEDLLDTIGQLFGPIRGGLAFAVILVIDLVMPLVIKAYVSGEMSSNAGGLIRWPVYALVPAGFALLGLQGISELIKRLAFLKGLIDDPTTKKGVKTAEEELAEAIRAQAEGARK